MSKKFIWGLVALLVIIGIGYVFIGSSGQGTLSLGNVSEDGSRITYTLSGESFVYDVNDQQVIARLDNTEQGFITANGEEVIFVSGGSIGVYTIESQNREILWQRESRQERVRVRGISDTGNYIFLDRDDQSYIFSQENDELRLIASPEDEIYQLSDSHVVATSDGSYVMLRDGNRLLQYRVRNGGFRQVDIDPALVSRFTRLGGVSATGADIQFFITGNTNIYQFNNGNLAEVWSGARRSMIPLSEGYRTLEASTLSQTVAFITRHAYNDEAPDMLVVVNDSEEVYTSQISRTTMDLMLSGDGMRTFFVTGEPEVCRGCDFEFGYFDVGLGEFVSLPQSTLFPRRY